MSKRAKYRVIKKGNWYYPQERTTLFWGLISYWENFVVYKEDANFRMCYIDVKYDSQIVAEMVIEQRKQSKETKVVKEYE